MHEVCLATPAIADRQILIRTTGHLYAVEKGLASTVPAPEEARPAPFPSEYPPDLELRFDDFEDGDLIAGTGVRWQTFTDGVSTARLVPVDGGAGGTARAVRLAGKLATGAARGPLAQMYQPFDRGAVSTRLAGLGGLRFWDRGNVAFDVSFNCGDGGSGADVELTEQWRLIEIGVDELTRTFADPPTAAWTGNDCVGLYVSRRSPENVGEFWVEVDEIVFYGLDARRSPLALPPPRAQPPVGAER
jgi:hypothetical protein